MRTHPILHTPYSAHTLFCTHPILHAPYSAHALFYMHVPQFCAAGRANSTGRGPFADALAELDDTVGGTLQPAPCTLHHAPCHTCCGYPY